MGRRFNMGQAAAILGTNPKTFKNWLRQDGIAIENQLNRADSREKYVTDEQIIALAKKRDIEVRLPDPERKPESSASRILAAMNERFVALEQQLNGRIDQFAAEIPAMFADLRHQLEQQLTHHFDQLDAHLEQRLDELQRMRAPAPPQERAHIPAPRASIAAPAPATSSPTAPPKPPAKKRRKRKTKARKDLPSTYVPLSTFRQLHHISEKAVDIAIQKNRLAVKRGMWLYQHRSIGVALDRQGQQVFYTLFYQREGFQQCGQCPHAVGVK